MFNFDPYAFERKMAYPGGLEPSTYCLEGSCSILLSYGYNFSDTPDIIPRGSAFVKNKLIMEGKK